ncbi:hypothetical protein [Corynebacterium casei]|uniref:hypothetical protein n=1 Tax=Corynebacterium casei TaxID=160386 RepID=UPI003F99E06F
MSQRPTPTETNTGEAPSINDAPEITPEPATGAVPAQSPRSLVQKVGLDKWPGFRITGASASKNALGPGLTGWLLAIAIVFVGTLLRIGMLALLATVNEDNVWGLLNKWDAAHYVGIAGEGYFAGTIGEDPAEEIRLAFFPAFPMIMRLIHLVTGLDYALAGILFNFMATVFLAAGVMALVARWGYSRAGQCAAAIVATTAPMSIVFNMPYTEALFGALAVWVLVALVDKRWWMACGVIFALAFVRITAIALVAVFAVMVFLYARKSIKAWVAVIISSLPLIGYIWWASTQLEHVGGYFGTQEKHWNTGFDFGVATGKWILQTLTSTENAGYLLTTMVIIGVPFALILAWRRVDVGTWLFSLALAANVLLSDGVMHSRPRLMLPAALLFIPWAWGALKHLPHWVAWILVTCWGLFGTWFSAHMLAVFPWAI